MTDPVLLTPREAANALGIGRSKLYELLQTGVLESVHIAKLEEQIKLVGRSVSETKDAAAKLTGALTAPRSGGRWGEDTLRNVLEMAGLSPYADFSEQTSNDSEKGRQRPDCIIRMPGGRELVIDSKLSLEDYLSATDQTDAGARRQKMIAHAGRVRTHVQSLTRKEYWKDFSERVDFVAMFIPVESSYVAALEHDRDIFDFAANCNARCVCRQSSIVRMARGSGISTATGPTMSVDLTA
jgi:DNA recombination protein RmuC